jgi:hypothetical protein
MTLDLASLAPFFDVIYSHLPGGSFFGFLHSLPDSATASELIVKIPGATSALEVLEQLGVTG